MILRLARWCSSSATLATFCMALMPYAVRVYLTTWPNGMTPCRHAWVNRNPNEWSEETVTSDSSNADMVLMLPGPLAPPLQRERWLDRGSFLPSFKLCLSFFSFAPSPLRGCVVLSTWDHPIAWISGALRQQPELCVEGLRSRGGWNTGSTCNPAAFWLTCVSLA